MTDGQRKAIIGKYVEETCNAFLTAYKDVVKVEYRVDDTKNAFVKVTTAFGFANYYDVTDLDCGGICLMLCAMMCNGKPKRQIKGKELIRLVEELFTK
ncbi:MAG: hypothetical protein IIY21_21335 [Clostridiales bacterium]|nr:hypothetical protein [Clostridiales bacterium]